MRLLIPLALWAAISFPLGMVAGRLLHRRSATVAEEAADYLRSRTPWPRRLGWPGAVAAVSALVVAVVVGSEAAERLPAAHLAATRGIERLTGVTTTTVADAAGTRSARVRPAGAAGAARRGPSPTAGSGATSDDERLSGTERADDVGSTTGAEGTGPGDDGDEAVTGGPEQADAARSDSGDPSAGRADDTPSQAQGRRPPVSDDRRDAARQEPSPSAQPTTTSTTEQPTTTSTTEQPTTTSTAEQPTSTSTTEPPPSTSTSTTEPPPAEARRSSTTAGPTGAGGRPGDGSDGD